MTRAKRTQNDIKLEETQAKKEEEGVAVAKVVVKQIIAITTDLPQDFIKTHTDAFIKMCQFVLKVDPTLFPVIIAGNFGHYLKTGLATNPSEGKVDLQDCFAKLGGAIIGQQISNTAAKNIRERVCNYFGGDFPTYKELNYALKDPKKSQEIKECGLSARKLSYLKSLAQYFTDKIDEIEILFNGKDNDEEIIENLVSNVKGIGPWSANMFLINALRRTNVFTADDLGIARGFSNYASKRPELIEELMKERTIIKKSKIKHKKYKWKIYDSDIMELCAERFKPYRTLFMFLLWRLSSDDMEFMVKMQEEFMAS
ncbi:DNA-3-methyladenine glycosylase [Monosporozyma unispora]|nr:3-methyladenine DNA glycosylase [Kazachstania unispora]